MRSVSSVRAVSTNRSAWAFARGQRGGILRPGCWDRWATVFEEAGYASLTPGWPDDPNTVEEARADPDVFANKTIGQVAAAT
jgi:hypothetical protein